MNTQKLEKLLENSLITGKGFTIDKKRVSDKDIAIFSNQYNKKKTKKGGILPLIPIFAGLSALGAFQWS